MSPHNRNELLESIATTVADYRQGEIPPITPDHVERWAQQFDDEDQHTILTELNHVLKRYYISRSRAEHFINGLLSKEEIFGTDPAKGVTGTKFLQIQRKGNSQNEIVSLVGEQIRNKYGVDIEDCGGTPDTYLYLDDCLFSGNTARYDIDAWLPNAESSKTLHLAFFAIYSRGSDYLFKSLQPTLRQKNIRMRRWCMKRFDNTPWETQKYECLWPKAIDGDEQVDHYVNELRRRIEGKPFTPRVFRPDRVPMSETLFSSPAARDIVERVFLKKGAYIVSLSDNPKAEMRPLGYEYLESLGFGSLFVTYRNIANNCPLVLWWGDPEAEASHPLSKWYPLFPRKVNEPSVVDEFIDF